MEKNIQNMVDETMNSFDNMQRAEMPPFFQTRLMARVEKANELEKSWFPVRKPILVIAVLTVLLLMNTVLLTQQTEGNTKTQAAENQSLQGFASEYQLSVTSTNY